MSDRGWMTWIKDMCVCVWNISSVWHSCMTVLHIFLNGYPGSSAMDGWKVTLLLSRGKKNCMKWKLLGKTYMKKVTLLQGHIVPFQKQLKWDYCCHYYFIHFVLNIRQVLVTFINIKIITFFKGCLQIFSKFRLY